MVQTWALTKIGIFNHETFTLIINFFEMYNRKAIEQLKRKSNCWAMTSAP